MGRFGPVAACLAALAVVSMGLIAWSHLGWRTIQERSHAFDAQLSSIQFRLHRSQWLVEEALRQPDTATQEAIVHPLDEARVLASRLAMEDSPLMQPSLTQWMAQLHLAEAAVLQRLRRPQEVHEATVRQALSGLDLASVGVTQAWQQELELARLHQSRLDKINMALVGGLTLVLLCAMWLAYSVLKAILG